MTRYVAFADGMFADGFWGPGVWQEIDVAVESIGSYGGEDPMAQRRQFANLFVMQLAMALVTSGVLE